MKRFLAAMLTIVMIVCLVGCSGGNDSQPESSKPPEAINQREPDNSESENSQQDPIIEDNEDNIVVDDKANEAIQPVDTPEPANNIRPEFKEAMDSYEAFFDEYVTFMKKFAEPENTFSMLTDYAKFLDEYMKAMESLEEIGEEELSTEELKYYMDVMNRINAKLLDMAT